MNKKTKIYLPYLDSVRGLAALSIFWLHFCGAYGSNITELLHHTPFSFLVDGKAAISMFLLLSGLGCSGRFFKDGSRTLDALKIKTLLQFYRKRFLRLIPPLFVAIGISYIAYRLFYERCSTSPQINEFFFSQWDKAYTLSLLSWIKQSLLFFPQKRVLLPQSWVLLIIAGAYVVFPLMIVMVRFSSILSLILVGVSIVFFNFNFGSYLLCYLLGILIVKHSKQIKFFFSNAAWKVKVLILLAGLFLFNIFHPMIGLPGIIFRVINQGAISACGAALIIVSFEGSKTAQRIFSFSVLRFLGKISYSLYLTHVIILFTFTQIFLSLVNKINITGDAAYYSAFVVSTALAILLAWLFWQISERPLASFDKYLDTFFQHNSAKEADKIDI